MRNLKQALALVIALTMVMGTVVFADFSDVTSGSAYAEAINVGVALNLYAGYEDGTFKPEGDITRAEFAAIVIRALGQEAQADGAKGSTKFVDVPSTHWAAGYINLASNQKIIAGYGDGNFGPEDKVTYEQAVKMLVVSLGYEPAVGSAGYPVGYLTIANQRGMTTGVNGKNGVAANRGQVAQLVYNSLDVPLMEQSGFGNYIEYIIQDGTGDSSYKKTLLSESFGVAKLRVNVKEALELSSSKKADLVKVKVEKAYNSKFADVDYDDYFVESTSTKDNVVTVSAGNSALKSLVGATAIVYVAYDESSDSDPVVLYATRYLVSSDTVNISSDDMVKVKAIKTGTTLNYYEVEYYETASSTKTVTATLAANANIYVNGDKVTYGETDIVTAYNASNAVTKKAFNGYYGVASFSLENTSSDSDYDTVFISNYETLVVTDVNTTTGRVTGDGSANIIFNPTNTKYSSKLVDKSGKALEWSTLEENNVLAVQKVVGSSVTVITATLVEDVVTGKITETGTDDNETEYGINGNYYKVNSPVLSSTAGVDKLELEDEGTFYLDIMGRIVNYEVESSATNNYAYVVAIGEYGTLDKTAQIRAFTYKGEMATFETTQTVRVSKYYSEVALNEDLNGDGDKTDTKVYATKTVDADKLYVDDGIYEIAENSVITFSLNSSGKISKVNLPQDENESGATFKVYADSKSGSTVNASSYDYDNERFRVNIGSGTKNAYVDSSTVIMQVGSSTRSSSTYTYDEDDFELVSLAAVNDDIDPIAGRIIALDANKNTSVAKAIIIVGELNISSSTNGVAMLVRSSTANNSSGDRVTKVSVLQNGNNNDYGSIDLFGTEDESDSLSSLKSGDVFSVKFNAKGEIRDHTLVANIGTSSATLKVNQDADDSDVKYYLQTVVSRTGAKIETNVDEYIIPSDANVYVYDSRASTSANKVYAPEDRYNVFYTSGTDLLDEDGEELDNVQMFFRTYEDDIVDVIFYLW